MRVITGSVKGRRLKEPSGMDIRPTTDMVKEAMFSIVQFDIEGRKVLDLFGGTGQLAIEALSRGAAGATIVDASRDSIRLIKDNLAACSLSAQVVQGDAIGFLSSCGRYDLILIDPPYDSGLAEKAVNCIKEFDILNEGGIIICETSRNTAMPQLCAPYRLGREYLYGKVKLTVYKKETEI